MSALVTMSDQVLLDIEAIRTARDRTPHPSTIAVPAERAAATHRLQVLSNLGAELGRAHHAYERATTRLHTATEAAAELARALRANETALGAASEAHEAEKRHVERSLIHREIERLQHEQKVLAGDLQIHEARVGERRRDAELTAARVASARAQWIAVRDASKDKGSKSRGQ